MLRKYMTAVYMCIYSYVMHIGEKNYFSILLKLGNVTKFEKLISMDTVMVLVYVFQ